MDPQACLDQAAKHLKDGNLNEARMGLDAYRVWREKGGFQPPGGDKRHAKLKKLWHAANDAFQKSAKTGK